MQKLISVLALSVVLIVSVTGCDTPTDGRLQRGFRLGAVEELFTITDGPVHDTDLSADAAEIACYFYDNETTAPYYQIRLYDTTGERETIVRRSCVLEHGRPRFSPDGTRVVYAELNDWTYNHIRLYDRVDESDAYLTDGLEAAWSPAGDRLVVARADGLYLVDLEAADEPLIDTVLTNLEWSADGAWIYGVADGQIQRVDPTDGSLEQVSDFSPLPIELDFELTPAGDYLFCWLPGGYPGGFAALVATDDGELQWLDDQFEDISIAYPALVGDEDTGTLVFQRRGGGDEVTFYRAGVDFSFPAE
jgi:hypothetical protein